MDPPETELLQRNSLDLWQLLLCQLVLEAVAGEEVEADPRGHAPRPTLPLQRVGPRNPRVLQALHALGSIVPAGREAGEGGVKFWQSQSMTNENSLQMSAHLFSFILPESIT